MVGWVGGWVGGNQVDNHATLWSNLQDCKISSRVEIPKLDPSVAKKAPKKLAPIKFFLEKVMMTRPNTHTPQPLGLPDSLIQNIKILRHSTGVRRQRCHFLGSFKQFWCILNYIKPF